MDNAKAAFFMDGKIRITGIGTKPEVDLEIAEGASMPFYEADWSYEPQTQAVSVFDGGCYIRNDSNLLKYVAGKRVELFIEEAAIVFRK